MIQLTVNLKKFQEKMRKLALDQVPYALSRTLNNLAASAPKKIIREIPQKFKIKRPWHDRGRYAIKVLRSSKRLLQAAVYTRAYWLVFHESGGIRRPEKGQHIAIPTRFVPRTSSGLISRSARPRRLQRFSMDKERQVIRGSTTKRKGKVSLMFLIRKTVKIKPRLEFRKTVVDEYKHGFKSLFADEFKKAIKSSK